MLSTTTKNCILLFFVNSHNFDCNPCTDKMSLVPNSNHDDAAQALLTLKNEQPSHLECRAASEVLARVILQRNGSVVPSSSLKQKKKQRSLLLTSSSSSSRNQFQLEFFPANASAAFLPPEALYGSSDPSSLSRRAISGGELLFMMCHMSFVYAQYLLYALSCPVTLLNQQWDLFHY